MILTNNKRNYLFEVIIIKNQGKKKVSQKISRQRTKGLKYIFREITPEKQGKRPKTKMNLAQKVNKPSYESQTQRIN